MSTFVGCLLLLCVFIHSFICSFVHSFIHLLIPSFIHSFVRTFSRGWSLIMMVWTQTGTRLLDNKSDLHIFNIELWVMICCPLNTSSDITLQVLEVSYAPLPLASEMDSLVFWGALSHTSQIQKREELLEQKIKFFRASCLRIIIYGTFQFHSMTLFCQHFMLL